MQIFVVMSFLEVKPLITLQSFALLNVILRLTRAFNYWIPMKPLKHALTKLGGKHFYSTTNIRFPFFGVLHSFISVPHCESFLVESS